MRSVLITGSSGFIGSHLFERFQAMEWKVAGIGRRPLSVPGYLAHDLADPLPDTLGSTFDVVVHAAARSSPWGRRGEFERANVQATKNVLDYCRGHGTPRLVFISSPSVYYRPGHQLNITEETPIPKRQINHYSATKRQAEHLVMQYSGDWVILRPRAVFGPGDTVLLPRIIRAARKGRLPIFTGAGGPVMGDLIYIDNVVDAVARSAADSSIHGCFNLTNNEPVPVVEFMLKLFQRLDIPAPRRRISVRSAMLMARLLEWSYGIFLPGKEPPLTRFGVHILAYSKTFDVTKMIQAMGAPRISVYEGLDRLVAWIKATSPEHR